MTTKTLALLLLVFAFFLSQCRRDDEIITSPSAKLEFSVDTLTFDTVFTTIGSTTKIFTVYNKNDKAVKISSVKVVGATSSYYKINVDGTYSSIIKDIEIGAKDSAFVFVQVKVDPTKQNAPLLISDSLIFELNGKNHNVILEAWGQDVHLIKDSVLKTQTWTNDKPYLVYGYALVDSFSTLTINEGATIYMHRDCIFAVEGKIICNGSLNKPIVFRGDRLDYLELSDPLPYNKLVNQWDRVVLGNSSTGNKFNYTEIRSGGIGLQVGVPGNSGTANVELTNCKIENNGVAGILAFNSKITAYNCLVDNAVNSLFMCFAGGEYSFIQCTFANYYVYAENPGLSIYLSNIYVAERDKNNVPTKTFWGDLKQAYFGNCLLFAHDLNNVVLQLDTNKYQMNYLFDNCLIRGEIAKLPITPAKFVKTKIDTIYSPGFAKIDKEKIEFDFRLTEKSKARNAGSADIANKYPFDFYNVSRTSDIAPDLGAFEYVSSTNTK